ncbi:GAF domain-containing protein [Pseudomonas duriflava]|nr:GAF domain-containing protein [Pseudomonas duriflava]
MKTAPLPENEQERLDRLHSLGLLDTQQEERFDRFVRLAMALCDVPIAAVSLVDANRQWFKGCTGLGVSETSRDISFCGHAILEKRVLYIPDAKADPRFADNLLVTGEPFIRFYAGCPIFTPDDKAIGTLCIIDKRPRALSADQLLRFRDLADCLQREIVLQMLMQDIKRLTSSSALTFLSGALTSQP